MENKTVMSVLKAAGFLLVILGISAINLRRYFTDQAWGAGLTVLSAILIVAGFVCTIIYIQMGKKVKTQDDNIGIFIFGGLFLGLAVSKFIGGDFIIGTVLCVAAAGFLALYIASSQKQSGVKR